jgi:hypothetical protein
VWANGGILPLLSTPALDGGDNSATSMALGLLTAKVRVRTQTSRFGFVVDRVALGQTMVPVLRFSLVGTIPPM